jgi:hypothetical protein
MNAVSYTSGDFAINTLIILATILGLIQYSVKEHRFFIKGIVCASILLGQFTPDEFYIRMVPVAAIFYFYDTFDYIKPFDIAFLIHHAIIIWMALIWTSPLFSAQLTSTHDIIHYYPWVVPTIRLLSWTEVSSLIFNVRKMLEKDPWFQWVSNRYYDLFDLLFIVSFIYTRFYRIYPWPDLPREPLMIIKGFTLLNLYWMYVIIKVKVFGYRH